MMLLLKCLKINNESLLDNGLEKSCLHGLMYAQQ